MVLLKVWKNLRQNLKESFLNQRVLSCILMQESYFEKEPNRYSRNIDHCPNMSDEGNTKVSGTIDIVLVRKLPNSERYYSQNSLYIICA